MASCMIHLYAGWLYAQKNTEFLDHPNFYLGCILPDCVNLGGFAKKEIRWHSHLRAADLSQWEENALAFYQKNRDSISAPLLTGYVIQILTDILWDRYFHEEIWSQAQKMEPQIQNGFDPGWNECFRFDKERMISPWWQNVIRPLLEQACPIPINGLSVSLEKNYLQYILHKYEKGLPLAPPRILTLEHMETLGNYLLLAGAKVFHKIS